MLRLIHIMSRRMALNVTILFALLLPFQSIVLVDGVTATIAPAGARAIVNMAGIRTTLTFHPDNADVLVQFDNSMSSGLMPGTTTTLAIHPAWLDYDATDKCGNSQLGMAITNQSTSSNSATFPSRTIDELEGKSIVIQNDGNTACATIEQEGDYVTAAASLRNQFYGDVYFRQFANGGNTFIVADLKTFAVLSQASWFIASGNVDCNNIGNPTQLARYNPSSANDQSCSMASHASCSIGNLVGKHGQVPVAAGSGSANPVSFTDTNLPLSGSNSVGGRYLIIYDMSNPQTTVACAKIRLYQERRASSTLSHQGITGSFTFRQRSPFDVTHSTVSLQGLNSQGGGYHVHNWPRPVEFTLFQSLCSNDVVGGHWNPFGINTGVGYPAPQTSTDDNYETGDLSSKYGPLNGINTFGPSNFTDWNLPLFGRNNIIGRSIVIHFTDGSRWTCVNIEPDGNVISAIAVFPAPVIGQIYFTQFKDYPETYIFARLHYLDGTSPSMNHRWQINTNQVGRGQNCTATGMIFNPNGAFNGMTGYQAACSGDIRFCRLGDLSGRLGMIDIGSASTDPRAEAFFTDSYATLSGSYSLIGRSVVVMQNPGTDILACANIQMLHDLRMHAAFNSGGLSGNVLFSQRPGFGQIPTMVTTTGLTGFNPNTHRLEIRTQPYVTGINSCSSLGDVYNPIAFNGATGSTDDQYPVGDLTRRGTRTSWYDYNLPMKGAGSILSHSLVVLNQNTVLACANINVTIDQNTGGYLVASVATFSGPLEGQILIHQIYYNDQTLSDASIIMNLRNADNSTTLNHNWHAHVLPIDGDSAAMTGRCSSAGPHYDPFAAASGSGSATYSAQCGSQTPLRCEVGDQSNKVGPYSLGGGIEVYGDIYLPLEGEYSVQGRSIVVHEAQRTAPRLGCADLIPLNTILLSVRFTTPQSFTKRGAATIFATAINTPAENVVVEVLTQANNITTANLHFLSINRDMLRSQFRNFISLDANRQTLGVYSSVTITDNANHVMSSVVLLLISFVVVKLLD